MADYNIRFAEKSDTDSIMEFIDLYWKKEHILATDKRLFEWQYINNDRLNFVLGIDDNNIIQGVLGFIPYDSSGEKDIALALWKANPKVSLLGIRLMMFLMEEEPHRNIVCPGINIRTTSKIYEWLGMKVDTMVQWYRLNQRVEYFIAKIVDGIIPDAKEKLQYNFERIETADQLVEVFDFKSPFHVKTIPYKSYGYVSKRYFNHPAYEYYVYALKKDEGKAESLFVFRIQECQGKRALRFVDCIGKYDEIAFATASIDSLMEEMDAEYVDMYEAGIDYKLLIDAGWKPVKETKNIIPNYFAPFEQSVVDIHYCTSDINAVLFRGDGDQDRPN